MGVAWRTSWGATLPAASFAVGCGLFPDLDHLMDERQAGAGFASQCSAFGKPQYLKAPTPATSAGFGSLLATDGDTLVVGAPLEGVASNPVPEMPMPAAECPVRTVPDGGVPGTGKLHPFTRDGRAWDPETFEIPEAAQIVGTIPGRALMTGDPIFDENNFAITTFGIWNDKLVVGSAGDDDSDDEQGTSQFRGSVRFFERKQSKWTETHRLFEADTTVGAGFGSSFAHSGSSTLVVGAPGLNNFQGGIFVYEIAADGVPIKTQGPLVSPNPQDNGLFGARVAVNDEWIVVGAPGEAVTVDLKEERVGAVYPFRRGHPEELPVPLYPHLSNPHFFGINIALDGQTMLVGAPDAEGCPGKSAYQGAGAIEVYRIGPSNAWEEQECLSVDGDQTELFGWGISLSPDWLAVGAPFSWSRSPGLVHNTRPLEQETGAGAGLVYLYARRGDALVPSCFLQAPNADPCDTFGEAVAFGKDFLAVGAFGEDGKTGGLGDPDKDNQLLDSGAVYLYQLPSQPAAQ